MFNEELFNFNIENIQNDLAIEGMEMFKMFANEQIQMPELIQMIKNEPINY